MNKPALMITSIAEGKTEENKVNFPLNVCRGGTVATITTRYGSMDTTNIITLAHFPMTAILIEYEQT